MATVQVEKTEDSQKVFRKKVETAGLEPVTYYTSSSCSPS